MSRDSLSVLFSCLGTFLVVTGFGLYYNKRKGGKIRYLSVGIMLAGDTLLFLAA